MNESPAITVKGGGMVGNAARFCYWIGVMAQTVAIIYEHRIGSRYPLWLARGIPYTFEKPPFIGMLFLAGALVSLVCAIVLHCQNRKNWLYILFSIVLFLEIWIRI